MSPCRMMGAGGMAAHQDRMPGGMAGANRSMTGAGALFGGVDVGLTTEQEAKVDDLVAEARREHAAAMQSAMSAQSDAAAALAEATPDLAAYEQMMKQAASRMVDGQMAMARAAVEARALLTPEQRAKLPESAQLMNTMMCGMMGAGSPVHHGPGQGGAEPPHR